ncbi:MAG: pyridoxine 5'-phosphate synthase [Bacteroidales bacterium]|nr:pyridoxine 5'-phosphate synthase [Bacteroidales bacterium]
MTRLSVNINKIATLRNSRGGNNPDVLHVTRDCESFGADGITVHPRPDERHIRRNDVIKIRSLIHVEFNVEGNPTNEFMNLVKIVRPEQVTMVPDAHDQITSNAGWDTKEHFNFLSERVDSLHASGIRSSIFVGTDLEMIEYAAKTGTDRVELYTEPYASAFAKNPDEAVAPFVEAAQLARKLGVAVNAGHDLNLDNLRFFHEHIPWLKEVSIGHALICDALYLGLEETIRRYKACLN